MAVGVHWMGDAGKQATIYLAQEALKRFDLYGEQDGRSPGYYFGWYNDEKVWPFSKVLADDQNWKNAAIHPEIVTGLESLTTLIHRGDKGPLVEPWVRSLARVHYFEVKRTQSWTEVADVVARLEGLDVEAYDQEYARAQQAWISLKTAGLLVPDRELWKL